MNFNQLLDNADLMIAAHQYDRAFTVYNQLIETDAACDEAYLLRGELYGKLGQTAKAFDDINKAISIDPEYDEAYMVLAALHLSENDPVKALTAYQKAIELGNKDVIVRLVQVAEKLADQLLASHQPAEAVENYALAAQFAPANTHLRYKHAFSMTRIGDFEQAEKLIDSILEIEPGHVPTRSLLVAVYEKTGKLEKGWLQIDKLVKAYPDNAHINIVFGKYALQNKKQEKAISTLECCVQKNFIKLDDQLSIHMLLGKLYDSVSDYSAAFANFSKANNLAYNDYDISTFEQQISAYIEYFSKDKYTELSFSENHSTMPIFILGMPRSGTSLVEQIISSHRDVHGGGELQFVPETASAMEAAANDLFYPKLLENLSTEDMTSYADNILSKMRLLDSSALKITDKLPHNFLFIGLIHKLFPRAKIINCLRDPVDNCLSCYFQHFGGHHPYAYNLSHLGEYYQQYKRLMLHWQNTLNIPILNVQYEALVQDTENQVRNILQYIDLEWDDACLDFYKTKRVINTSSYNQVNRKIYTGSLRRWLNYEPYIGDLLDALKA